MAGILVERQNLRSRGISQRNPNCMSSTCFLIPLEQAFMCGTSEGYTATDIFCRYKRMAGFNVLHPMGWDAFGLPAEQYAIKTENHPAITTKENVDNFRRQIQALGFSYDWDPEIDTTDPNCIAGPSGSSCSCIRGTRLLSGSPGQLVPGSRYCSGQ